jgi:glycosyltransferase involved in cell wall biosynthesis
MKIAYFDLGVTNFFEDYSINPKGYGGGSCFAKWAKEILNNDNNTFVIIAQEGNFKNLGQNENSKKCFSLPKEHLDLIKNGYPVDKIIQGLEDFDIIIHHHDCLHINKGSLKAKSIHWSLSGRSDGGHPLNDCDLLYLKDQTKNWESQRIEYIKLGKFVPKSLKNDNRSNDFIFQCSRHDELMNSIEVAKNCLKYNIKGVFAGPIHNNYNLMQFIDDKITFYIGMISEEEKLNLSFNARLTTYLHKWETPFNQSVIESLGQGTPILANKVGFFNEILKDERNGFIYNGNNFLMAYENSLLIDKNECLVSAKQFSTEEMIQSFVMAFEKILK